MEKPQQDASRKELADKLRGARKLDKELAQQYLDKVSQTEGYKTTQKQTRSEFKEFKDSENEDKINALKKEIENIGKVDETTNAEVPPAAEGKNITPEGQAKVDALVRRQEAFQSQSEEEINILKQNYKKSLETVDLKITTVNDNYEKSLNEIGQQVKEAEKTYTDTCAEIDRKIKEAEKTYTDTCAEINKEITTEGKKTATESPNKSTKLTTLYNKLDQAKTKKDTEVYTKLSGEKDRAKTKKDTAVYTTLSNEKDQAKIKRDTAVYTTLNNKKSQTETKKWQDLDKLKVEKERINNTHYTNLENQKKNVAEINKFQQKIAQAKIDGNPETLKNIGLLENSLRSKIDALIKGTKSEEDAEEYQIFVSGINNLKNLIKENKIKFQKKTAYPATIENMNKYSKLWEETSKYSSGNPLKEILKNIDDPKKVDNLYGYLKSITTLTPVQTKEILKAFGFGENKQLRDIYDDYNKQKSFFSSSAKQGKKHDFTLKSNSEGINLRVYNYKGDRTDQDSAYFFADKKLIKELFENSKV